MKHLFTKLALLLTMIFITINLTAQVDTLWTYEDNSTSILWGVDTDSENNIIFGGDNNGIAQISKMTTNGTIIWSYSFDDYVTIGDILVDTEDNIWTVFLPGNILCKLSAEGEIVSTTVLSTTATFTREICFASDGNILTASCDINSGWLVTKLNSNSEIVWSQMYVPVSGCDFYLPRQINVDSNDNIFIVGEVDSDYANCIVLKLDPDGNEIWDTQPISLTGAVQSVICDSDDNIIIAGTNRVGCSYYVIKLNQDGEVIWTNQSEDSGTSFGISFLSDGTLLTAGDTGESIFDGDFRLSAYDSSGNSLWTNNMNLSPSSEYWTSMVVDSNDHVICVGTMCGTDQDRGFMAKYDVNGLVLGVPQNVCVDNEIGVISWEAPGASVPISYNVYLDNLFIESTTDVTYTFEALTLGQTYMAGVSALYNDGESSIVEVELTCTNTGINEDSITITNVLNNYPNPFNPETTISYNVLKSGEVKLDVYNIKGQLVKTLVNSNKKVGIHTVVWNGTDDNSNPVSSGIYFYKMSCDKYNETKKMVLMK